MAGRGEQPPSKFGRRLRELRESKGLTQKELGDAASVHVNTVARLEREEQEPAWPVVLAFAQALGVPCTAFSDSAPETEGDVPEPAPAKPRGRPKARPEGEEPAPAKKPGKKK